MPARSRRGGERADQAPVDRFRQTGEAEEAEEGLAPVRQRHEGHVDRQQEQEHHRQHRPGEVLEHALDGAAEGQNGDDEEDEAGGDPRLRDLIRSARHAAHPRAEERGRGAAGERRPTELEESDERVEPGPELRPRPQAHDAAVDRLAGVERVADRLEIEDDLQDDGDGGDEEDGRRVLDCCRRTDQPLAAADRRRRHDRARPDHFHQVARAERQWRGKIRDVPARQRAVVGRQGRAPAAAADRAPGVFILEVSSVSVRAVSRCARSAAR